MFPQNATHKYIIVNYVKDPAVNIKHLGVQEIQQKKTTILCILNKESRWQENSENVQENED